MLFRDEDFFNLEGHFLQMGLKGKEIKQASIMLEKKMLEGRCVFFLGEQKKSSIPNGVSQVSPTTCQLMKQESGGQTPCLAQGAQR